MASDKNTRAFEHIENLTSNSAQIQQKVLAEILKKNAQTEYLQRFKIGDATDPGAFKSKVPIISYEDIKPEIQRIANGDRSPILTMDPVTEFFTSSGTTGGEKKLIPVTSEDWDRRLRIQSLGSDVIDSHMPDLDGGKSLFFVFVLFETKTPGGLLTQNLITKALKSISLKNRGSGSDRKTTSPIEAIFCPDHFQSMYAQMLCGLYKHQEVNRVGAPFASGLLRAIRFLQLNWQDLAHEIRTGSLNQKITDSSIRSAVTQFLEPNPGIADFIVRECSSENWEGIVSRIWPRAKYLIAVITGTMTQYIPMLKYYSGGLQIISTFYVSSESHFGFNLNPICEPSNVSYTIMPNLAYFEFIPHEQYSPELNHNPPLKTVDLVDVEEGKEYEILVTTYAGLYRYQVGDIVRVTGFHNSAPNVQVVRRKSVILSVDLDKTDEIELQKGIDNASQILRKLNVHLIDYTSYASIKETPGHYVIYLELLQNGSASLLRDDVLCQCCLALENSLNPWYRKLRAVGAVGPLEIRVLKSGTFEELMADAISTGASASQYKVPRCIKAESTVELLDSRAVSTHFSKSVPRQGPDETE